MSSLFESSRDTSSFQFLSIENDVTMFTSKKFCDCYKNIIINNNNENYIHHDDVNNN